MKYFLIKTNIHSVPVTYIYINIYIYIYKYIYIYIYIYILYNTFKTVFEINVSKVVTEAPLV